MTFPVTLGQAFNKKAFYHFTKDSYMLQESAPSPFCDIGSISLRASTTASFKVPS